MSNLLFSFYHEAFTSTSELSMDGPLTKHTGNSHKVPRHVTSCIWLPAYIAACLLQPAVHKLISSVFSAAL